MNKAELISAVAEKSGLTKAKVELALNSEHIVIKETVSKGEEVKIVGFGTYEARLQAERITRTPKTKEVKTTAPKMVPKFNASKEFKEGVAELPVTE